MRSISRRRHARRWFPTSHRPAQPAGISGLPRYDSELTASATRIQFR